MGSSPGTKTPSRKSQSGPSADKGTSKRKKPVDENELDSGNPDHEPTTSKKKKPKVRTKAPSALSSLNSATSRGNGGDPPAARSGSSNGNPDHGSMAEEFAAIKGQPVVLTSRL